MGPAEFPLLVLLLVVVVLGALAGDPCPCTDIKGCRRPPPSGKHDREIFAFTDGGGATHHEKWDWDAITTVITTHDYEKTNFWELMCFAHHRDTRFGFTKQVTMENVNEAKAAAWIEATSKMAHHTRADVVVVDLIPYFHNLSAREDINKLNITPALNALQKLKQGLQATEVYTHPIRLICISPWLPPCAEKDCVDFRDSLNTICDFFLLHPDSYTVSYDKFSCQARASIPLPRMVIGMEEYVSRGISNNRIILGIPWHGYKFKCVSLENDICKLPTLPGNGTSTCDIRSRSKVTLVEIFEKYKNAWTYHNTSTFDFVPYFNINKTHQVWFEDSQSLKIKYHVAHDLGLKGIAIITADDLTDYTNPVVIGYDQSMWNWAIQSLFYKSPKKRPEKPITPGMVAGAAGGCLVAGAFLGVVFTCLALKRTVRKPRDPFIKDADEYHDDDPNL